MYRLALLIDDYIDLLLRDASIRVGLLSVKTKPTEWVTLMGAEGLDGADRAQNIKIVAYVVHHLLNANKLMNSFSNYFEQRMQMPFSKLIIAINGNGREVTLVDLFRKKLCSFKSNLAHLSRFRYKVTISKGENYFGGKGNKLEEVRDHKDMLFRRRQKRSIKKEHRGRVFYLNYYFSDGQKLVKVRSFTWNTYKDEYSS